MKLTVSQARKKHIQSVPSNFCRLLEVQVRDPRAAAETGTSVAEVKRRPPWIENGFYMFL